jgi:lysophospholipase
MRETNLFIFFRAAQNGAGVIAALDIRNQTSKAAGTGGLFQAATYMSGLSGGSWLLSSLLFHDNPDMHALFLGDTDKGGRLNGWHLEKDLWRPAAFSPLDKDNENWYG